MNEDDLWRDLTRTYYHSPFYHALMRSALALMGEATIDMTVLGLPMDRFNFPNLVKELEQHYTGRIDLGFGRAVNIRRTIVHRQPFGGYLDLGSHIHLINEALVNDPPAQIGWLEKPQDLQKLNVIVTDTGSYKLDWPSCRRPAPCAQPAAPQTMPGDSAWWANFTICRAANSVKNRRCLFFQER